MLTLFFVPLLFFIIHTYGMEQHYVNLQWIETALQTTQNTQRSFYDFHNRIDSKIKKQKNSIPQANHNLLLLWQESLEIENILPSLEDKINIYFDNITILANTIDLVFDISRKPPVRPLFIPHITYDPLTKLHSSLQQIQAIIAQHPPNPKACFMKVLDELHYQLVIAKITFNDSITSLFRQQKSIRYVLLHGFPSID